MENACTEYRIFIIILFNYSFLSVFFYLIFLGSEMNKITTIKKPPIICLLEKYDDKLFF